MTQKCEKCWCPSDIGHNVGCPHHPDAAVNAQFEWEKGWAYGFDDNYIDPCFYNNYNKSFIFGYRQGKAEIDALVDDAAQNRY